MGRSAFTTFLYSLCAITTCTVSVANAVVIGDKDWRQLTETRGFSYNMLVDTSTGVCSAADGKCSGFLGGVEFTGWTWASLAEVGELFNLLVSKPGIDFSIPSGASLQEYGSDWAPVSIDADGIANGDHGYFYATSVISGEAAKIDGITRTDSIYTVGNVFMPVMLDQFNDGIQDAVATTTHGAKWLPHQDRGIWMYRDSSLVPEPTTLALLTLGLAGIGFVQKKKQHQK